MGTGVGSSFETCEVSKEGTRGPCLHEYHRPIVSVPRSMHCSRRIGSSDGAKGLIAAIEQVFPAALRLRCLIHRLRNVLAKTPAGMQAEIHDGYWAVFDTDGLKTEPGPRLVELIDNRLTEFAERYAATYPAAMKILLFDREGLTAYLRFPAEHHQRIRHSNFIERTFAETRRPRQGHRPFPRRNELH
jgi:putative transposase